jgi:hypothetical protein
MPELYVLTTCPGPNKYLFIYFLFYYSVVTLLCTITVCLPCKQKSNVQILGKDKTVFSVQDLGMGYIFLK